MMLWPRRQRDWGYMSPESGKILSRWQFTHLTDGTLRIVPQGPSLRFEELRGVIARLRADCVSGRLPEHVVFDFGEIDSIEHHWTATFAILISFARSVPSRIQIVSLHGQPAAVAALFNLDQTLRSMIYCVDFKDQVKGVLALN